MNRKRLAIHFLGISASLLMLVACGGGGGGSSTPTVMQPSNPAQTPQQSISIPLASTSAIALPSISGITGTIALSSNGAPAGSALIVGVSTAPPKGMVKVPASGVSAFEYFSLTPSANVKFTGFPKIALTLPSAPHNQGQFSAWMYDVAQQTWTDLGTVKVSGTTVSFGGSNAGITLKGGSTYVVVPFTSDAGATCPTPPPTPTPSPTPTAEPCVVPPTPTPGPTPSGTKLYVVNSCMASNTVAVSYITVYDEKGNQVPTTGSFPNLATLSLSITFDSVDQELFVGQDRIGMPGLANVFVYDRNGNQIVTSGLFPVPNAPPEGMAFDPLNLHLYVAFGIANAIVVYDRNGNTVSTTGTFPNLNSPHAVAVDSLNQRLYVPNSGNNSVTVYDQNGNQVSTTGTFPNLSSPFDITFDSSNRQLYVLGTGSLGSIVNVFDENGNPISITGTFPNLNNAGDIAFDPSNRQLYVPQGNTIAVYDQNGNKLTTTGTFPNLNGAHSIAVVP